MVCCFCYKHLIYAMAESNTAYSDEFLSLICKYALAIIIMLHLMMIYQSIHAIVMNVVSDIHVHLLCLVGSLNRSPSTGLGCKPGMDSHVGSYWVHRGCVSSIVGMALIFK